MLYLFLLGVANRSGTSYYSDQSVKEKTSVLDVAHARGELIERGLISYSRPFYKLLDVPGVLRAVAVPRKKDQECPISADEQVEIDRMLNEFMESF